MTKSLEMKTIQKNDDSSFSDSDIDNNSTSDNDYSDEESFLEQKKKDQSYQLTKQEKFSCARMVRPKLSLFNGWKKVNYSFLRSNPTTFWLLFTIFIRTSFQIC